MAKRTPLARPARPARPEVRVSIVHVVMDDMDCYMFTDPDYPDILVTASNPQSFAEWLKHAIEQAIPNIDITGFTVLQIKPGGRRTFPRMTHGEDDGYDGDTGDRGA